MKHYLSGGVYAEVQSGMIKLTTGNGSKSYNTIFLDNFVTKNLIEFYKRVFLPKHKIIEEIEIALDDIHKLDNSPTMCDLIDVIRSRLPTLNDAIAHPAPDSEDHKSD